jgi:hypothetical protein
LFVNDIILKQRFELLKSLGSVYIQNNVHKTWKKRWFDKCKINIFPHLLSTPWSTVGLLEIIKIERSVNNDSITKVMFSRLNYVVQACYITNIWSSLVSWRNVNRNTNRSIYMTNQRTFRGNHDNTGLIFCKSDPKW